LGGTEEYDAAVLWLQEHSGITAWYPHVMAGTVPPAVRTTLPVSPRPGTSCSYFFLCAQHRNLGVILACWEVARSSSPSGTAIRPAATAISGRQFAGYWLSARDIPGKDS